jgi:hypothetical protein
MLEPQLQHGLVAGEREIAEFLGERDRLASDYVLGDGSRRVDAGRPPGGIARLALGPGPTARSGWILRRHRQRRFGLQGKLGERVLVRAFPLLQRDFFVCTHHSSS